MADTIDETFKLLKRIPHRDMEQKYNELSDITWNRMTNGEVDNFFSQYGWTEHEYRSYQPPWMNYGRSKNK